MNFSVDSQPRITRGIWEDTPTSQDYSAVTSDSAISRQLGIEHGSREASLGGGKNRSMDFNLPLPVWKQFRRVGTTLHSIVYAKGKVGFGALSARLGRQKGYPVLSWAKLIG